MTYTIKTFDGVVVRAKATRPYKAAWIGRDKDGNVIKGLQTEFTTNPREIMDSVLYTTRNGKVTRWTYESLVAVEQK